MYYVSNCILCLCQMFLFVCFYFLFVLFVCWMMKKENKTWKTTNTTKHLTFFIVSCIASSAIMFWINTSNCCHASLIALKHLCARVRSDSSSSMTTLLNKYLPNRSNNYQCPHRIDFLQKCLKNILSWIKNWHNLKTQMLQSNSVFFFATHKHERLIPLHTACWDCCMHVFSSILYFLHYVLCDHQP